MATIDDIISRAQQVRDETAIGANTATRVGSVMKDTADHVKQNEIEVDSLETTDNNIKKATYGYEGDVHLIINTSQYLTKRKDFQNVSILAGKTYVVVLKSTTATDLATKGFYFYSSADTIDGNKYAFVKEVDKEYTFIPETDGVLRFYDYGGSNNEELFADFVLWNNDSLHFTKAEASDVSNLRQYVDEHIIPLDEVTECESHNMSRSSYDAEHTLEGYLGFSTNPPKYAEYNLYRTCYFTAPYDGTLYVSDKGGGFFNLAIGTGTLSNLTNCTRWGNGETMPSEDSPATVHEGDLVALSFINRVNNVDNDFEIVYGYYVTKKYIPNENIREYDDVLAYIHGDNRPKITLNKIDSTHIRLLIPDKLGENVLIHPLTHNSYTRDMSSYGGSADMVCGDNWDPGDTTDSSGNRIVQGNLNFIYKVDDTVSGFENENLHVGTGGGASGHGLEVREWTKFFADGVEVDVENMDEDITCSVFRIIQKSNCYAADSTISSSNTENYPKLLNGNPIVTAQHYLDAEYEIGNRITWRNKLIIRRNGVVFNQLHGAMLRSFTNKLNEVIVNDNKSSCNHFEYSGGQYVLTPIGDSNTLTSLNVKADEANMYGNNIHIYQRMIQDDGTRFEKSFMMCNKYEQTGLFSFKIYFMPALVSVRSSVASSETFNSGDVISVTNVRVIECS